ncbi:hypothetical protein DEU56DRAFT_980112 [Suillus clintonianus]|uniref:uncharacterized protein n=1 Tax=Suillus clintonianus TaxID=1904413 RepID=UPI001B8794C4|nr:uncharacterized protein DEU56DRAFT_980112 [Suillus clintonianus]KAG2140097.1 hypothetical protein DEU56DRAFT_980112 [Suillus clintonianus]
MIELLMPALGGAIVQLNDVLHGAISHEPGQMGHPKRNITARDFLEAFRRHDNRLSDELLGDVYDSIRCEHLCQARTPTSGGPPDITVNFKRPLPPWLTYRVQSEPVVIRIPQPDPHFSIKLFGHDLVFDPPVLSFAESAEASFRVTGRFFGHHKLWVAPQLVVDFDGWTWWRRGAT